MTASRAESQSAVQHSARAIGSLQPVEGAAHRGLGARVQPDLGVAEVVVVDQQQGRPRFAGQGRHLGPGAADVGLDAVRADQGAGVVEVVEADPQPVRPRLLPAGGRVHGVLEDGDGDRARRRAPRSRWSRVEMPEVCSHWRAHSAEVAAGRRAQGGQQVGQRRVRVGVVPEVPAGSGDEGLETRRRPRAA